MRHLLLLGATLAALGVVAMLLADRSATPPPESDGTRAVPAAILAPSPRVELPARGRPRREPTYDGRTVRYGELAVGPRGEHRLWLVESGERLYVDLDRDDDLTDPDEAFSASVAARVVHADVRFRIAGQAYQLRHGRDGRDTELSVTGRERRRWVAWGDENGSLRFATRPEDAPIVWIEGPLQMGCGSRWPVLHQGEGVYRVSAGIGCYGRGEGCFAHLDHRSVPVDVLPEADLVFIDAAGILQATGRTRLEERC